MSAISTQNAWRMHSQHSVESIKQLASGTKLTATGFNSSTYIQSSKATNSLRSLEMATRNINDAISMLNSIDSTAQNIQRSIINMQAVAMSESDLLQDNHAGDKGRICDYFQAALEGINDMAAGHSWNGKNFMVGGGENNHTTTELAFSVNVGGSDTTDNFQISLKSFHPHSTVDRDGHFFGSAAAPNIADLNRSAGTDTHVYGDAALYHGSQARFGRPGTGAPYDEGHLHGDNKNAIDNTLIQLDRALDGITAERGRLGSFLSRLTQMAENVSSEILNKRIQKSQIEDTDYASEVAQLSKAEILKQSSTAVLIQLNNKGENLLQLLQ